MKFIELKGDTWQKKLTYFKDYYLGWTLLIIGAVVLGIYFIYTTVITRKDVVLSVIVSTAAPGDTIRMTEELNAAIGSAVGLGERETADCMQVGAVGNAQAVKMAVLTRFGAGDIDLYIAEREDLVSYAETGFMEDLSQWLPAEIYNRLLEEDALLDAQIVTYDETTFEVTDRADPLPYAVELKALPYLAPYLEHMTDPVLGIAASPDEPDEELAALRFFMYGTVN